ncbi:element excision factor XisI family protein [Moorena sp. SIO3H5]|uniref:element excision factor XisI family protein n=1 Tax=Moorena sp. SIO3H5 TaxID=2607834 RepID=UPI003441D0E2
METTNQALDQWRETLENILKYYANLPYRYGDVTTSVIISSDRNHFMLLHEGWEKHCRVYGTIAILNRSWQF